MSTDKIKAARAKPDDAWSFRLYVSGDTQKSRKAIDNLNDVCDRYFKNRCNIEIIDLEKRPELAALDQIFTTPTLRILAPPLLTRMVGDLSHVEKVLFELNIPLKK